MSFPQYHFFAERLEDLQDKIDRWVPTSRLEEEQVRKWNNKARRESWIAGRVLIKQSIQSLWRQEFTTLQIKEPSCDEIEIITKNLNDKGIRPLVTINNQPLPGSISLSHSDTKVMVALSPAAEWTIGIDLTSLQNFNPINLSWCWSPIERALIKNAENPTIQAASLWSLKEACYKAMNRFDEGFNPTQVLINQSPEGTLLLNYYGVLIRENCSLTVEANDEEVTATALINPEAAALEQIHKAVQRPTF